MGKASLYVHAFGGRSRSILLTVEVCGVPARGTVMKAKRPTVEVVSGTMAEGSPLRPAGSAASTIQVTSGENVCAHEDCEG